MAGPLLLALILYLDGSYEAAFAVLLAPALLALSFLLIARLNYPNPSDFELAEPELDARLPTTFWIYLLGVALIAAAYTDFPLIAFHFKDSSLAADGWTPVFYAVAMGVAGASSLVLGRLFDRFGVATLVAAVLISACFPVLVFYGGLSVAFAGIVCWGIGLGAQESVMKAAAVHLVPANRRASAFGTFDFGFGLSWFAGSALMGFLYDQSLAALVTFSVALQLGAALWILVIRTRLLPPERM